VWNRLTYVALAFEGPGDAEAAARLVGGVSSSMVAGVQRIQRLTEDLRPRLTTALGSEVSNALVEEGRSLTPQHAFDLAERAAADHLAAGSRAGEGNRPVV